MQTKHFQHEPKSLVPSSLRSLQIINPHLRLDVKNKVIYGPPRKPGTSQVSIISGGGAGHEPSFSGFVGNGLLSAAVSGSIFASPSSQQVLSAIENVDSSRGILVIVMNYTGDVLNFGVAVEKAKARNPDMNIEMLVVADDVAVTRSQAGKVGRRGIAGTVLVHKIAGAMAAAGHNLRDVVKASHLVATNVVSIGVSLSRVHVPGRPVERETRAQLGSDEIELGMGIHNETGCGRRSGPAAELSAIIGEMLSQLLNPEDEERHFLSRQTSSMILLVNNLGALSVLELGAVVTETVDQLERTYSVNTTRVYAGTFMTSLDGPGFSLSLLAAVDLGYNTSLHELLDAESNAAGWHHIDVRAAPDRAPHERFIEPIQPLESRQLLEERTTCDIKLTVSKLQAGLHAMIEAEPDITQYDEVVGDGDCGTTLKRGCQAIMEHLSQSPPLGLLQLLQLVTSAIEDNMDGTSGALYSIFLNSMMTHVKVASREAAVVDTRFWADALSSALTSMSVYTPAQKGDRTLMDALIPFVETLKATDNLQLAAQAAQKGAIDTKSMRPGLGRTVYIGGEERWLNKVPDPGAWALSQFFEGIAVSN